MSVRGVQSAFRRVHGLTPTAYLRGIRLLLAREHLASGTATSVGDVAHAAGITHLGRFAAAFHAEFGERPGDVLRAANNA